MTRIPSKAFKPISPRATRPHLAKAWLLGVPIDLEPESSPHDASGEALYGPAEGYLDRISKFVPIEGLAPVIPLSVAAGSLVQLWVLWFVGLAAAIGLIFLQENEEAERPGIWFWPMVVISFFVWTLATSSGFRGMFGDISEEMAVWFLGLAAFGLPIFDLALTHLTRRN